MALFFGIDLRHRYYRHRNVSYQHSAIYLMRISLLNRIPGLAGPCNAYSLRIKIALTKMLKMVITDKFRNIFEPFQETYPQQTQSIYLHPKPVPTFACYRQQINMLPKYSIFTPPPSTLSLLYFHPTGFCMRSSNLKSVTRNHES